MSPEQPATKFGQSVGEKLRAARIARRYTQSQLAVPDFSVSYISAIERGQIQPSLRALEILASRLGLTPTELLHNHDQQEEPLRISASQTAQNKDEIEFALLEAHLLIMHNNPTEAIAKLDTLAAKNLKPPLLLQQRYLQGLAYFKTDQFRRSESTLSEAERIAKDLNATHFLLHILNQLALTYAAMHNYEEALQTHQRCLTLLDGHEKVDPFYSIQVYTSLGHYYIDLEDLDQALEALTKALTSIDELPPLQAVYAQLCDYYIMERDYQLATLYAHKSIQINHQDIIKQIKLELHHYLGHALMQQDANTAWNYITATLQKPDILESGQMQASLMTRKAEWHLAHQELAEAELSAQQAHQLGETFGDSIVNAEALIIRGHIKYAQGHYEEGSQQVVGGLEMLERLGSQKELADEFARYAELLEKLGKEHEAFIYFRRAFQCKQKLGQ
jgi:tetratricopeptide (TPR) repeat protein